MNDLPGPPENTYPKQEVRLWADNAAAEYKFMVQISPDSVLFYDQDGDFALRLPVPPPPGRDPLAEAERAREQPASRMRKQFDLATGDRDRGIDALVICAGVLDELDLPNRRAALDYLNSRFGKPA